MAAIAIRIADAEWRTNAGGERFALRAIRRNVPDCTPCNADRPNTNTSLIISQREENHPASTAIVMPSAHASSMAGVVTFQSHARTISIIRGSPEASGREEVTCTAMKTDETDMPPIQPMTAAT